jgi:chemotaxis protein MotB
MPRQRRPVVLIQGAPEWMVTFGDMMSLLLTFFILLFSVARMKDTGQVYDMIYALQGMATGSRPVHGFLLPNPPRRMDDLPGRPEAEKRNFGEGGLHGRRVVQSEGDGFHSMRVRDQLKITVEGRVLFEEGERTLLEEGRRTLERLLVPRFRDGPFRVVIRGHAVAGEAPGADGEDDLGYQRAREVRDFFVERGIPSGRFELQTAGARFSPPGEDQSLPEARRHRRRVEIFVSPQATGLPVEEGRR